MLSPGFCHSDRSQQTQTTCYSRSEFTLQTLHSLCSCYWVPWTIPLKKWAWQTRVPYQMRGEKKKERSRFFLLNLPLVWSRAHFITSQIFSSIIGEMGIISAVYIAALVASRSINERQKCLENAGNKGKEKDTLSSKKTKPCGGGRERMAMFILGVLFTDTLCFSCPPPFPSSM